MTPRKSSFVNLLKGKGWNAEDLRLSDGSTERDLTISKGFETSEESSRIKMPASASVLTVGKR
jgi:hypothetical protein